MTDPANRQARTIADFGAQWSTFDDLDHGFYGNEALQDIVAPFLAGDALRGARVAEIGSGTGRIVRMLVNMGAAEVTAVEPAAGAFDTLKRNTADISDRIRYHNVDGSNLPGGSFDYIFSIGVVHHIPEPKPVLAAAEKALADGGKLIVWLYGKEGNEAYLAFARPLRAVTQRLPDAMLRVLCWLLTGPLWLYIRLCRWLPLPMRAYMRNVLARLSTRQLMLNVFDQLNPAYAKYYTRAEARALLADAGLRDIELDHRHGYSWTVCGTKRDR